ncbi:MAG: Oxygen-independent coproporphyrinogen-III oxidase 1 [Elusimicrobia bacterium ADurb.Bin231]|nr:MAG: Oxygen-independent coproporphyrinogen-III oxidase 1 [Elusimicrobia bacterium ADurb.Bin231]
MVHCNTDRRISFSGLPPRGCSAGIYVHIPFCRKKCGYCDFVSFPIDKISSYSPERYVDSLIKEFSSRLPAAAPDMPVTIYVGGGTPSVISSRLLFKILFELKHSKFAGKSAVKEFTVELNPESVSKDKLGVLKECGVDRLSFGAQSLDDRILNILGRVHNVRDFLRAYRLARETGFQNINIDLIFGIPGQSLDDFKDTLNKAISLSPEHISAYSLSIETGTEFYLRGMEKDEETDAAMYEYVIKFLKDNGYSHYEISNFSKPGFECAHNVNYWLNGEYFGFGLSAASHLSGVRRENTGIFSDYIKGIYENSEENLSPEKKIAETIILGLRMTDGVRLSREVKKIYKHNIMSLVRQGLLKTSGDYVKLSDKGIIFADTVFREFL